MFKKKKKHCMFFMLDQFRTDFVSYDKELQALLTDGLFFSNVITYAPYTVGAMHAAMSGMYGSRNGVDSYYGSKAFKDQELATLAEVFQKGGFQTIGDTYSEITLPKKGFDRYLTYNEDQDDSTQRHTQLIADTDFSKPVFMYLHYNEIHVGLKKDVLKKYDDFSEELFADPKKNYDRYGGYIKLGVSYVKALVQALKDKGVYDDCMIVFLTDHGSNLGDRKGERAYGVFTYHFTINTWFSFIGMKDEKKEFKEQVPIIDVFPTIVEYFGLKVPEYPLKVQAQSLFPIIDGKDTSDRIAYCETAPLGGANPSPNTPSVKCVTDGTWKFIVNVLTKESELYNLKEDPKEENNLVDSEYEKAAQMRELLAKELSLD